MFPIYTALKVNQAWLDLLGTSLRSAELMLAAGSVVQTRTGMMQQAARSPLTGNYAELGRMVPEKVAAFTAAGSVLEREWKVWQDEVSALAGAGTFGVDSLYRWTDAMTALWAAPGAAMRPIHKTATANARRLSRKRRQ